MAEKSLPRRMWIDAYNNLQFIKEQISQVYEVPVAQKVFKQIDQVKKGNIRSLVVTLKDYFSNKVNSESKEFLRNMI